MSKKVEDLKVFPTVAAVIGEAKARLELFKLRRAYGCKFSDEKSLMSAFIWSCTPQGVSFWSDIDDGVNPYDNQ